MRGSGFECDSKRMINKSVREVKVKKPKKPNEREREEEEEEKSWQMVISKRSFGIEIWRQSKEKEKAKVERGQSEL